MARILKLGGVLFLAIDYWEEQIQVNKNFKAYGLPWKTSDKKDILEIIDVANKNGIFLWEEGTNDLECGDKCVVWRRPECTFICAIFKKRYV